MAISHELSSAHELSCEIATALFFAKERSPRELNDLKEVIFKIHSTLEQLTHDARVDHVPQAGYLPPVKGKAAGKDS